MKKLLFIHWNIMYGDNGYHTTYIQELHLQLIRRYRSLFDEVRIVLHTPDIHDISTIHHVKVMFDKIFGNKVKFNVSKNSETSEIDTFKRYFLPIVLGEYNSYDLVYYIHNKGVTQPHTNNMRVWVAGLYYFNFEHFSEHVNVGQDNQDIFLTGGLTLHAPLDLNTTHYLDNSNRISKEVENVNTSYQFVGGFFGVFPKNYRKTILREFEGSKDDLYKVAGTPEIHFFNGLHDETHIHHDSHIDILHCESIDEYRKNYNPYDRMDPVIQMLSREQDINNTFTLARGQEL